MSIRNTDKSLSTSVFAKPLQIESRNLKAFQDFISLHRMYETTQDLLYARLPQKGDENPA
jgi:hypothetical protein